LERFAVNLARLPREARKLVTVENDDKIYTPADLLPFCQQHGIPFVYDVHHHRCKPDGMSEEEATRQAVMTWNREPLFHISSPLEGWSGPKPHRHHDYINVRDFPPFWQEFDLTVEIEAKAKELAIKKLAKALARRQQSPSEWPL
jgi:UV DNA damage endonuclease